MNIKVIASSKLGNDSTKEQFDDFSGKMVGLECTLDDYGTIMLEDEQKSRRRAEVAKTNDMHSFFDHESITLCMESAPKILSVILNSIGIISCSEKGMEVREGDLSQLESTIHSKWLEIFKNKITKLVKDSGKTFTEKMIENMAEDNANLMLSIFTPTTFVFTTTYKMYNKAIAVINNYITNAGDTPFDRKLSTILLEFVDKLKNLPYYDKNLAKAKDTIKLLKSKVVEEYYGDVYATSYDASFDYIADVFRNTKISYDIKFLQGELLMPSLIVGNEDLSELWISDIKSFGEDYMPMCTKVFVNEKGMLDDFIDKLERRQSEFIESEKSKILSQTLSKCEYALRLKMHSRTEEIIKYVK